MHITCTKPSLFCSLVKVLCAAAVNTAMFISDHARAVKVLKEPDNPTNTGTEEDKTMSLLWVCTGVTNLSKVRKGSIEGMWWGGGLGAGEKEHTTDRAVWSRGHLQEMLTSIISPTK